MTRDQHYEQHLATAHVLENRGNKAAAIVALNSALQLTNDDAKVAYILRWKSGLESQLLAEKKPEQPTESPDSEIERLAKQLPSLFGVSESGVDITCWSNGEANIRCLSARIFPSILAALRAAVKASGEKGGER